MKRGIGVLFICVICKAPVSAQKWYIEPAYNRTVYGNSKSPYESIYRVGYMLNMNAGIHLKSKKDSKIGSSIYGGIFYSDVHYEVTNDHPRGVNDLYWFTNAFRGGLAIGTAIERSIGIHRRILLGLGGELHLPIIIRGYGYKEFTQYYSIGGVYGIYFTRDSWSLNQNKLVAPAQIFLPFSMKYRFINRNKYYGFISYQYHLSLFSDVGGAHEFYTNYHRIALRIGFN